MRAHKEIELTQKGAVRLIVRIEGDNREHEIINNPFVYDKEEDLNIVPANLEQYKQMCADVNSFGEHLYKSCSVYADDFLSFEDAEAKWDDIKKCLSMLRRDFKYETLRCKSEVFTF